MKIDIQSVGFDASPALTELVNERIDHVSRYYNRITGVDVYLKTGDDNAKLVEVKAFVPGPSVFSEHKSLDFRESIHEAFEKLKKQLLKTKDKQYEKRA